MFRRGPSPIIQSEKHIVQITLSSAIAGTVSTTNVVSAVHSPSDTDPKTVEVGTVVKAVWLEIWMLAVAANPSTFTLIVEKLSGSGTNIDATEMGNLHGYTNKKNILYTSQGLLGENDSNPVPILRQWVLIPKGKQRFGLNDRLQFSIKSITEDTQWCGAMIYLAKT